jgi:predicted MFS family arabinose efflux permease
MKEPTSPTTSRLPAVTLMLGNVITGIAILAPSGMLAELAEGLNVGIRETGLLVTLGAVILCLGSPLVAWATSHIDRRKLLAVTVAVMAVGHVASAFSPNYATLLILRLVMLAVAAIYTPQAAGTISLIVPEKERASAISFVFLGWSLSVAAGLPLVTFLTMHLGWQMTFGVIGLAAAAVGLLHVVGLPAGLKGTPLQLRDWTTVLKNRTVLMLLLITILWTSSQFMIFPFLGPLLKNLAMAPPSATAAFFAVIGVAGFVGNVIATRIVSRIGAYTTSLIFVSSLFLGRLIWAIGAGQLAVMGGGALFLGLGFAALNSMQQARLVAAVPVLASATIALNTSTLYVGQAIGSGLAGWLLTHGRLFEIGYGSLVFIVGAVGVTLMTKPRKGASSSS